MAKFLNKKEQVIDFQFSPYGKYLLSIGRLKPVFYAFIDDTVLYDSQYAGFQEPQNNIHTRIKKETVYIESLTNYGDPTNRVNKISNDGGYDFFEHNITPVMRDPKENIRKNINIIGDAFLEAESKNIYPSWKLVTLSGEIEDTTQTDELNSIDIPQIYITASYVKKVVEPTMNMNPEDIRELIDRVGPFSDGTEIQLVMNDPVIYLEEVNTQLLKENFDMEIYEVLDNGTTEVVSGGLNQEFIRKYFDLDSPQIVDGYMIKPNAPQGGGRPGSQFHVSNRNTGSVEYYFDILVDNYVDHEIACKGANVFNKSSYYIDLDFDCDVDEEDTAVYADIYGSTTEPSLCR